MRATIMRNGKLIVGDLEVPEPGRGEMLVRTIACGICGTDLHFLQKGRRYIERSLLGGSSCRWYDPDRDVVMGHEFVAEVVRLGPETEGFAPGDVVTAMPMVVKDDEMHVVGMSNEYPGGYGEYMVISAARSLAVSDGVDPRLAALTEPMAVGRHTVNAGRKLNGGELGPNDSAIVLGCGPIGLAVVSWLAADGVGTIIAAEFSSTRRNLAKRLGATEVVDPREESAFAVWRRSGSGVVGRPPVVFEAVGVPGLIAQVFREAPENVRLVVVGLCMESDEIEPLFAIEKEISVQFVISWTPDEFSDSLRAIVDRKLDVGAMITDTVGVENVSEAFERLMADSTADAKILVTYPRS